jgi:hypothetical protein
MPTYTGQQQMTFKELKLLTAFNDIQVTITFQPLADACKLINFDFLFASHLLRPCSSSLLTAADEMILAHMSGTRNSGPSRTNLADILPGFARNLLRALQSVKKD